MLLFYRKIAGLTLNTKMYHLLTLLEGQGHRSIVKVVKIVDFHLKVMVGEASGYMAAIISLLIIIRETVLIITVFI